jgi:tetratricopeptide (TPR) repeat protein
MSAAEELAAAHQRAARYWRWRVGVWLQGLEQDVLELIEARHHLHTAGELEEAVAVTNEVVLQLDTWGAWGWEERLCLETLGWLPERSRQAASYQHQLGMVAYLRSDYEAALGWYWRSLAILEELGDRAGMAGSYHQLGMVAHQRGDYDAALDWYRRSLAIEEKLGNRAGIGTSYHQLGLVAQDRGDYEAALDWYRRTLAIDEELGDRAGMASSYHQLGMVAHQRGDYEAALDWYRRSLAIKEELGDRAGMARTTSQMGILLTETEQAADAVSYNLSALSLRLEMDLPEAGIDIHWLGRQRALLGEGPFSELLRDHVDEQSINNLMQLLNQQES